MSNETHEKMKQILVRLTESRRGAGLSQSQAAKIFGYSSGAAVSQLETGTRQIDLPFFLTICETYDISPVWALTGVNPDFDERAFDELTQGVNASLEDIANLKETLQRLSHGKANND